MEVFGFHIPLWLLLIVIICISFYKFMTYHFGDFKKIGISGPKPKFLGGTIYLLMQKGFRKYYHDIRETYGDLVGTFFGRSPCLVVFDVDFIQQIAIKNFSCFRNRYENAFPGDYPMDKTLPALNDDHWRHVRNLISPTFSGSRLRKMVDMINHCGRTLVGNLAEPVTAGDSFECKEYAGSYTMDVIASTAFGLDLDTQKDKNSKFASMARKVFNVGDGFSVKLVLLFFFPFLRPFMRKVFGFTIFPQDAIDFFAGIVQKAIKEREENKEQAPRDFLQLMMDARIDDADHNKITGDNVPGTGQPWNRPGLTQGEILSNSLIFLLAGFNTSADAIALTLYTLAVNQHCQEKAYREICQVLGDKAEPDYDDMKKMHYVTMCIEETMRIYPPGATTDRVASCDTTINGVLIAKDMIVRIPIVALHNDPRAWPEPDKFDPERFSPEAKESRHPCQYAPFGIGPRSCVAMRLAMLKVKMAIVHILKSYKLVTSDKTQIPLKMKIIKMEGENGTWIKAEHRT